ncbi:MAG: HAD-IC family P-type ATPase [Xenococcaceae cyanobacterium]
MLSNKGLTEKEVNERRAAGKINNVALTTSRSYRQILQENLLSFINLVFLTIGVVMVLLKSYSDAFLVVVVVFSGVLLSVIQEIWAKRKLDRIALLNRPKATVIRDGKEIEIEPRDIVLDDSIAVRAGDSILVDGEMVGDGRIEVDESLLTGESDLIFKVKGDSVYSGTICVSGSGYFEARKVGADTVAYKLVTGARAFRQVYTPLQQEINLVMRILLLIACFLWILIGISYLSRSYSFAEIVQHAAVVAGLVPSGLLIAITLAYGTGAVRMLGENILIQQANAVESLSNVNVLCLDKTGTLTTSQIELNAIFPIANSFDPDILDAQETLRQKLGDYATNTTTLNYTVEAIAASCPGRKRKVRAEIPFASSRKWSAIAYGSEQSSIAIEDNSQAGIYVLGAPEMLCASLSLTEEMQQCIYRGTQLGLRVLLFAYTKELDSLEELQKSVLPSNLTPLAILYFSNQLRDNVRETLSSFAEAGIELKIISGDNPETVTAIALQAGFTSELRSVSGLELAVMDEAKLAATAASANIFGRITPEQKAKLVKILRQQGHYVAIIGDGVNDVLALKVANLGISMQSGSKATRAVADIILLKDSFSALPHAFLEGQRIRNGIRDSLALFIVRVFCVALLIFASAMVTDVFPFLNKQSALLAIFGVGLPTIVLPLWARSGEEQKYSSMVRSLLHFTVPATLSMTIVSLLVYLLYLVRAILDLSPEQNFSQVDYALPRTALVIILVLCHLFLLLFLKPPTRFWVGGESLSGDKRYAIAALVLFVIFLVTIKFPPSRNFFQLALLSWFDILFLVLVAVEWCLILRVIWRTKFFDRFLGVDLG